MAQSSHGLLLGNTRIAASMVLIDHDMLIRMWDEMDYPIIVCRITKGGHIERLQNMLKKNLVRLFVFQCNKMWYLLRS
jgi:hypothetical protein